MIENTNSVTDDTPDNKFNNIILMSKHINTKNREKSEVDI